VTVAAAGVHSAEEIERTLIEFAKAPPTFGNRQMIADMAAQLHLPAVYSYRFFVTSGGLASYGIDGRDLWRAAASYIDRILRGEKSGDLPVQLPTKYYQ
jgi:putative ABC transport system substrate-binding protein